MGDKPLNFINISYKEMAFILFEQPQHSGGGVGMPSQVLFCILCQSIRSLLAEQASRQCQTFSISVFEQPSIIQPH